MGAFLCQKSGEYFRDSPYGLSFFVMEEKYMARKSRYIGYVEGLEQLKAKHEKRRRIEKEK